MENFPEKDQENSKINLPGTEQVRGEFEKDKKETQELIAEVLKHIQEGMKMLESDIDHLEFAKQNNEKYSQEDIRKLESEAEDMKQELSRINALVTELTLSQVEMNAYMEEVEALNHRFKTLLTKIHPRQAN